VPCATRLAGPTHRILPSAILADTEIGRPCRTRCKIESIWRHEA